MKSTKIANYPQLLGDIKSILKKGQYKAYKAVDNILVQTYWQVGERIVREELENETRAEYGKYIVDKLAQDIGISRPLFYKIVQFYRTYPNVLTVSRLLSWSHYEQLITIKNQEERVFYQEQIEQNAWSVRVLRDQIKKKLYQNVLKKGSITIKKRFPLKPVEPEEVFKDTYHFDFLDLDKGYDETKFKDSLLNQLEKFLQELGPDFFVGRREVSILIGGNYDKVDLELFHAGLLCYILVEVKNEQFTHKHVSQMYSYLNYYKEHKVRDGQRAPIGLIICKTKDKESVHYALGNLKKEIFVAKYKTRLPTKKQIQEALE